VIKNKVSTILSAVLILGSASSAYAINGISLKSELLNSPLPSAIPLVTESTVLDLNNTTIPIYSINKQSATSPPVQQSTTSSSYASTSAVSITTTSTLLPTIVPSPVVILPAQITNTTTVQTVTATIAAAVTTSTTIRRTSSTTTAAPMPLGCIKGVLEDNGVWNCQNGHDDD
jgi:hypothetical protein